MQKVVIGAGSGFWGDTLEPAVQMAEQAPVSHMGFDHLSELTMAILSRQKAKDPSRGFVPDVVPWMEAILPAARRRGIKLLTNAGGANPRAAAQAVARTAASLGCQGMRIGVVGGDDIGEQLPALEAQGHGFVNLDTGEEGLDRIRERIVAANVYVGADGIVEQLAAGSDVIITGRVSDNALYVGPLMHEFGWDRSGAYTDQIAAGITVGHVIECAACVTGGMSNMWRISKRPWDLGFPIAEVSEDGSAVITKTPDSGGVVNEWTVKEHLLYEIKDPNRYVMPDGVADFTAVRVEDQGNDRVALSGMRGWERPDTAKALVAYENGWIGEGMAFFPWPDALEKAQHAMRWLEKRIEKLGVHFEDMRMDLVGVNMLHGSTAPVAASDAGEVGVRFAVRADDRERAEFVRREITHLWSMGPAGASIGVPARVRPVVSLWPTLVPWDAVTPWTDQIEVAS